MSRDLFREVIEHHPSRQPGRFSALPISVLVHIAVLLLLVVIPLLASDVLPQVLQGGPEWTPVVMPVTPPPQLPKAAPSGPRMPVPDANLAPVAPPTGIARENLSVEPPSDAPNVTPGEVPGIPEGELSVISAEPPPPAPKIVAPVPVHSLLRPPVRIHYVVPGYPEMARMAKVQGTVIIEAIIGPTGSILDARVLRSIALLDAEALAAVRQWKYSPSLLNGVPVPVVMTVTVTFTLQ